MDSEVARTLAELEHKLQDLERALGAVGEHAAGTPLGAAEDQGRATARLVDERLEDAAVAPPSSEPSPPIQPEPTSRPDSDESIDLVELARFRDHLERTMSELLTDYERVIRLRSAAEPRPPVE